MKKKPVKKCRWCGVETKRHCGICLKCCNERDAKNKRIDAGLEVYVPPQDRPGHRLYERKGKPRTEKQLAATERLKLANRAKQMAQDGV